MRLPVLLASSRGGFTPEASEGVACSMQQESTQTAISERDGTSLAPSCSEQDRALMARPDIRRLLELDRDRFIAVPIHTTPESAPIELANLAVRQSRRTAKEGVEQVAIPHPRFEEAVAAARAESDEDQAFEVAKQILDDEDAWAVFQRPV